MWKVDLSGKGRRAVVLSISDGTRTYKPKDIVEVSGGIIGMIASLHTGETDNSHSAELLLFETDDEDKAVLVTSRFKRVGLNSITGHLPQLQVSEALGPSNQGEIRRPLPMPLSQFASAQELSDAVISLFHTSPRKSPRKVARQSPQKRPTSAEFSDEEERSVSSGYSDSDPDHEDELIPKRKRNTKNKLTALPLSAFTDISATQDDLATPTKKPPLPRKTHTPRKRKTEPTELNDSEMLAGFEDDDEDANFEEPEHENRSDDEMKGTEEGTEHKPGVKASRPSRKMVYEKVKTLPPVENVPKMTVVDRAVAALHPASDPATHPCRDDQYDRLFIALESAIAAQTGTCIYISGTPGTGKTSTVREVIGQLDLRVRENELQPFTFVEINGMKLVHPNAAYEHLWAVLNRGSMAASNSMTALENSFTANEPIEKRGVIVVLLDELDQLITKGQQLMYNFFNWPSLPHSRLIVIAIANTMDLPERVLSNKISSRVGLTRIQFAGYTHEDLKSVIYQRLEPEFINLVDRDALDYVTRKVAGVGGDARRTLSLISRAILAVQPNGVDRTVKTSDMRDVIVQSQASPLDTFLLTLGVATKVLLCAIITRVRRTNNIEAPLHEVLKQAVQLAKSSTNAQKIMPMLYPGRSGRLRMFRHGVNELVESGLLVQQALKGEATQNVRLMVPVNIIKDQLEKDTLLKGMI